MTSLDVLPPSPPTTSSRKPTSDGIRAFLAPPIVMSTPDDSPASIPGSSNLESRKKVVFSAQPNVYDAAVFTSSPEQAASIKRLPPSREHRTIRRSILKAPSFADISLESLDGQQDEKLSINENMDSIVQQLAQNDKMTSLDAYNTLASMFRAYDELPEAIVLKKKLNTLIKFIRRDLGAHDNKEESPADTNLSLSALKLLIILVWSPTFSPLLSDEHRIFILDRSIHVICEHRLSKAVVAHYLHLLATQDFRPPMIAANNRANRLLDALKELPQHVSGSAVMSATILLLSRLADQVKSVMKTKADCWVEVLLRAMVSPSRDTRQKAISFGMKACSAFASTSSINAAFRDMLRREETEGMSIELYSCKRLKAMFVRPEDAIQVPQIWATVLILAVNVNDNIDNWSSLRTCWLDVIQKCFNCSDTAVRVQANFAWNRLVCLSRPHQASDALAALLGKPVAVQVDRSGRDKSGRESRVSALSSYCNLLYYAFRPAASHKQYTRSWNEYVVKIMRSSFFKTQANVDFASRIFMALTWNSTRITKVWKDSRAHDNSSVEPEELPTIDAKWLRRNCEMVLQMFKFLFEHGSWAAGSNPEQGFVAAAWKCLAKSLHEASSKEIIVSSETVQACTQVVKFIQRLWVEGPTSVDASEKDFDGLVDRLSFLLRVTIAELGAAPFTEVLENHDVQIPTPLLHIFASTAVEKQSRLQSAENRIGGARLLPKASPPTLLLLEQTLSILNERLQNAYTAPTLDRRDLNRALDLLCMCLPHAHRDICNATLRTLQSSIQIWLEDKERSPISSSPIECDRVEISNRVATIVIPSLARVPAQMVTDLDELFAAAFRSTHKETINKMVDMWKAKDGDRSETVYGPNLTAAFAHLQPYVDIHLMGLGLPNSPRFLDAGEQMIPPAFLRFVETQSQMEAGSVFAQAVAHTGSPPCATDEHPESIAAEEIDQATTSSRPQSSHSTPQRVRRHNDSQIEFQPIDSSPPSAMLAESQFLTDRQKEVRERQRQAANVYFPDLKTDLAPKAAFNGVTANELERAIIQKRPTTPKLSERPTTDFDNNVTASPTPRSKHQALLLEEIETPSSPLDQQGEENALEQEIPEVEPLDEAAAEDDAEMEVDVALAQAIDPAQDSSQREVDSELDSLNYPVQTVEVELSTRLDTESPAQLVTGSAFAAIKETSKMMLGSDFQPGSSNLPTSPESCNQPHLDSDELDMLSQSQLSQDLDCYVSEQGDTPEPGAIAKIEEAKESVEPASVLKASRKKRKRTFSSTSSSKRRKSQSVSRSASEASQDEEVHDFIVVDTTSRIPLKELGNLERQNKTTSKPRESEASPISTELSPENPTEHLSHMESPLFSSPAKRVVESELEAENSGIDELNDAESDVQQGVAQEKSAEGMEDVTITTSAAASLGVVESSRVESIQSVPQTDNDNQGEPNIMSSLRDVLERLKQATGEGLDLRALDDLCFHIRTEGQNAVNRWSSS